MGVSASKKARANGPAVPRPEHPQEAAATSSALRALMLPFEAWTAQPFSVLDNGEEDPSVQLAEVMDRSLHYLLSRVTLGLSPMGLAQAYFDWLVHLIAFARQAAAALAQGCAQEHPPRRPLGPLRHSRR